MSWECQGLTWGGQLLLLPWKGLLLSGRVLNLWAGAQDAAGQGHSTPPLQALQPAPLPPVFLLSTEPLPDVVVNGVLQGLYGFSTSPARAQPEVPCHPAPPPMP